MATANPSSSTRLLRRGNFRPEGSPAPRVRHWWRWGLAAGVLVPLGLLGFYWKPLHARAQVAAAYGARVGCACHYIGGRGLSDCRKDFEDGMGPVTLSADEDAHTITARYLFLAIDSATYRSGPGCVLKSWE